MRGSSGLQPRSHRSRPANGLRLRGRWCDRLLLGGIDLLGIGADPELSIDHCSPIRRHLLELGTVVLRAARDSSGQTFISVRREERVPERVQCRDCRWLSSQPSQQRRGQSAPRHRRWRGRPRSGFPILTIPALQRTGTAAIAELEQPARPPPGCFHMKPSDSRVAK